MILFDGTVVQSIDCLEISEFDELKPLVVLSTDKDQL